MINKNFYKNIEFRMILLIVISFVTSIYTIIDYSSIVPFRETGLYMQDINFHILDFIPGDSIISSLEYILFYNVVPIFCCLLGIGIVFDVNRKEKIA